MSSEASSDPIDLEKGVTGLRKEEEEELPAVNTRKSMRIKLLLLHAIAVLYVLCSVGYMAWAIMVSNTWWDVLLVLCMLLPILLSTLWLTTKMKKVCIQGHATEEEASDDSDLSTNLLVASSSNKK